MLGRRSTTYAVAVVSYLGVIALIPWSTFPPFPWIYQHMQWSDALLLLSGGAWLWALIRKEIVIEWTVPRLAVSAYLVWAAVAATLSEDPVSSAVQVAGVSALTLLFLMTSTLVQDEAVRRRLPTIVSVTSLLVGLLAVLGFVLFVIGYKTPLIGSYGAELTPSPYYARVQGAFYHPALLGSYCIFASSLVAGLPDSQKWLRRVTQTVLAVTVLLTISRAFLGFVLAAVFRARKFHPTARALTWVAAVVSILVLLILAFGRVALDPRRPSAIGFRWQTQLRAEAIPATVASVLRDPLTGLGPGAAAADIKSSETGGRVLLEAHVTPLNIAATLGLPALLAAIVVVVALWKTRSRPTNLLIWGGLAGLGIDALSQDIERFRHVWILLGLAQADADRSPSQSEDGFPGR